MNVRMPSLKDVIMSRALLVVLALGGLAVVGCESELTEEKMSGEWTLETAGVEGPSMFEPTMRLERNDGENTAEFDMGMMMSLDGTWAVDGESVVLEWDLSPGVDESNFPSGADVEHQQINLEGNLTVLKTENGRFDVVDYVVGEKLKLKGDHGTLVLDRPDGS